MEIRMLFRKIILSIICLPLLSSCANDSIRFVSYNDIYESHVVYKNSVIRDHKVKEIKVYSTNDCKNMTESQKEIYYPYFIEAKKPRRNSKVNDDLLPRISEYYNIDKYVTTDDEYIIEKLKNIHFTLIETNTVFSSNIFVKPGKNTISVELIYDNSNIQTYYVNENEIQLMYSPIHIMEKQIKGFDFDYLGFYEYLSNILK